MTATSDIRPRRKVLQLAASFLAVILQTQIGHIAMAADDDFLKFSSYNLSVRVFNGGDFRLVYANSPHALAIGKMAGEKTDYDAKRAPGFSSYYTAFAGPAEMEWRSKDGSLLKHTLDLDSIFKDRKVLHKEDPARIYKPYPISGLPDIVIEANDRTVNVYMFTTVQIIPEDPNATRREAHDNCVLAYSKTL